MRFSFFTAAAVLGLVGLQTTEAITIEGHDFDFADYELAEIQGEGEGKGAGEVDLDADADADADSEESVVLKLSGEGGCEKPKPQLPFDQQMLLALQELSGKSMTLYEALKSQFAKSQKLQNSKTMSISGNIKFSPAGDGPLPEPEEKCPAKCGDEKEVKLTITKADDCGCEKDSCKPKA